MSPADFAILVVITLVVSGPKKLPQVARELRVALREFRRLADEFIGRGGGGPGGPAAA